MAKQEAKNESNKTEINFKTLTEAKAFIEEFDLRAVGSLHRQVVNDIETLNNNTESLTVAIRKVLSSDNAQQWETLRKRYQQLFDGRADTHNTDEEREAIKDDLAVLKRATRTATDVHAKKRNLWDRDYQITCNTIKNNGIAKFDEIPHKKAEEGSAEEVEEVKTDLDIAYEYIVNYINAEDFKVWCLIAQSRLDLEAQGYDKNAIEFVGIEGKKPAHFRLKKSA